MGKHNINCLYVVGDSFSFGVGLKGHDPKKMYTFTDELRDTTYSGIIATKWEIPVYKNASLPGGSNDRMARVLFEDISILLETMSPSDILVNISLTEPSRREVFSTEKNDYIPYLSHSYPAYSVKNFKQYWEYHTLSFAGLKDDVNNYIKNVLTMQMFLDTHGIRYIITKSMHLGDDFEAEFDKLPAKLKNSINKHSFPDIGTMNCFCLTNKLKMAPCLHPTEEGHRLWAAFLMEYIEKNNIV